jgi:hypothetical protein
MIKELHVYDLDMTLYRSPEPPEDDPTWYYHAHSFGSVKGPGFDRRWNLDTIAKARHSSLSQGVMTIVLSARPENEPMRRKIEQMIALTGIEFDKILLRPITYPGSIPKFKAACVAGLLTKHPTVDKVACVDDEADNLSEIAKTVQSLGRVFDGRLPVP